MKLYSTVILLLAALSILGNEPTSASPDANFGPHAVDQCSNPVKTLTNKDHGNAKDLRIPPRDTDGSCNSDICVGDCVAIEVDSGVGKAAAINVIAGGNLPDPGNCSDIAINTNKPSGSWDFTATGACGKGSAGNGIWKNCLVHDVCVWARCTDDDLKAGGLAGRNDRFCGQSWKDSKEDISLAHGVTIECYANGNCAPPLTCLLGYCIFPRTEGRYCDSDAQCLGYCELLRCRGGNLNDICGKDSDCQAGQSDLSCQWYNGIKKCRPLKSYGDWCGQDADCGSGLYCQFTKCLDGRRGDKCRNSGECQGSLRCKRRCRICAQKTCQ